MSAITLHSYLIVGAILFGLGLIGFVSRRNMIIMFLCVEMMLQGVAINLTAFARFRGNLEGQAFVLFMLAVAACEAAVALALILMLYRQRKSLDVSLWQDLREAEMEPIVDDEPLPALPAEDPQPILTPAGAEPKRENKTYA